ncbi:MAG: WhiB family transcriptional regulator [Actinomycetia bacterium]|nr:WhiB family transcriptional regulator [Actinomycetes bacterium]
MTVLIPIVGHVLDVGPESHWSDHGLCRSLTEVFIGPAAERPRRRVEREATARTYCHTGPVMFPCRDSARSGLEHGFWGGENDEERAIVS